jgi:nucleoside-diphosphate-sugar epimerase
MTDAASNTLVLGGTGNTGSRVAANLTKLGLRVCTAARNGADVRFDWDDPTTHSPALADVDRVYLVEPVLRTDFADQVSSFLDLAQAVGVRRVTYLSAFGIDQVPPQWVAHRAVCCEAPRRKPGNPTAAGVEEHSPESSSGGQGLLFRSSWPDEATFTESVHPEI